MPRPEDHQAHERMALLARQVGHDFNNFLSSILGYASLLKSKLEGEEKLHRYAEMIEEAGNQAGASAERLLAYGRAWTLAPSVIPCSLAALQEEIGRVVESEAETLGIQAHIERTDAAGKLAVDLRQLQAAIEALRANVVDQAMAGHPLVMQVRMEVVGDEALPQPPLEPAPSAKWMQITVRDDGPGMDEEMRAKALEPGFTTVKGARRQGLGLPMVMGFAHAHRGLFAIDSAPGEGTTVKLWLPIHEMG